jgi:hypothetical protein
VRIPKNVVLIFSVFLTPVFDRFSCVPRTPQVRTARATMDPSNGLSAGLRSAFCGASAGVRVIRGKSDVRRRSFSIRWRSSEPSTQLICAHSCALACNPTLRHRSMDSAWGHAASLHDNVPHNVFQPQSHDAIQVRRLHLCVYCASVVTGLLLASLPISNVAACDVQILLELRCKPGLLWTKHCCPGARHLMWFAGYSPQTMLQ